MNAFRAYYNYLLAKNGNDPKRALVAMGKAAFKKDKIQKAICEIGDMMQQTILPTPVQTSEPDLDPALYIGKPKYIRRFVMELTNHCNLRCLYCHQNKPEFKPTDPLSDETFQDVLDYLTQNPPDMIDLTGGGDILMANDWARKCDRLLELGIRLATTINLGKILEDHEIETLSRFSEITVSIDTIDRKILSDIRKSVDIRTIMYNMMRIKGAELRRRTNIHVMPPNTQSSINWVINAVYSAQMVTQLPTLASYAVAFGVNVFRIQDVMIFNDIENNVTNVWDLRGDDAVEAAKSSRYALDLASHWGLQLQPPPHFLERLQSLEDNAYKPEAAVA